MLPSEDLHNSLVVVVAKLTEERHQRNPYGNKVSNKIKPLQQQITKSCNQIIQNLISTKHCHFASTIADFQYENYQNPAKLL
jgi:hypothetical protein